MKHLCSTVVVFLLFVILPLKMVVAQVSLGGKPLIETVALPTPPVIDLTGPDMTVVNREDSLSAVQQGPYRIAIALPADFDVMQKAQETKVTGGTVWRLMLRSRGAKALSVTFGQFKLPEQGRLFVYDANLKKKIGAFTSENNPSDGVLALEMVPGESLILEYFQPEGVTALPQLVISELLYVYRSTGFETTNQLKDFGQAEKCEVNVNCPEGTPFSDPKHGVVRVFIRAGVSAFWCSGSLVNNTNRDFKPYILSAAHCREGASLTDFNKWVFYFNYESASCPNPTTEPVSKTMSGCSLVAVSGTTSVGQSDFLLVQLNQSVPINYNAWYMGWSREITSNPGAVGIHHPAGDIKKISSVLDAPVAVTNYGGTPDPNGSFWAVNWKATVTGFGVTEPGSSGSPLLNKDGKIIGTLSGGTSDCTNSSGKDYYGKVSAHWTSDGTTTTTQLAPWLDPVGSATASFLGAYNNNTVKAQFAGDAVVVPPGSTINFSDLSFGSPNQWTWSFVGAVPSSSNVENPKGITYDKIGNYDVQLIVANNFQKDTLLLRNYIQVRSQVYPNPTNGKAELFISKDPVSQFEVMVSNTQGMQVSRLTVTNSNLVTLDFTNQPVGIYFITAILPGKTQTYKLVVAR